MNISLFKSAKDNKQHEEIPFKKYLDGIKNVVLSYYLNGKRDMPKDVETKLKHLLKRIS